VGKCTHGTRDFEFETGVTVTLFYTGPRRILVCITDPDETSLNFEDCVGTDRADSARPSALHVSTAWVLIKIAVLLIMAVKTHRVHIASVIEQPYDEDLTDNKDILIRDYTPDQNSRRQCHDQLISDGNFRG
jgi:hypothetical protein